MTLTTLIVFTYDIGNGNGNDKENIRKKKIEKMVEDMLLGNKSGDSEVTEKNSSLSKLLMKNLESIKKIADKEGISVSELIKALKKSE